MTTATDYTALITSQYNDKPKFVAWVTVIGQFFADAQNLLTSMAGLFDLDVAVATQLDAVGDWVGFKRSVNVPGLGITVLDDTDYRTLLRAKILSNHWDGTFEQLQFILTQLFPGSGIVLVPVDNQDMSMSLYVLGGTLSPLQLALLKGGLLVPKPEGVRLAGIIQISGPLFGLGQEDSFVAGPGVGGFPVIL